MQLLRIFSWSLFFVQLPAPASASLSDIAGNKTFLPYVLLVEERSHLFWGGGDQILREAYTEACMSDQELFTSSSSFLLSWFKNKYIKMKWKKQMLFTSIVLFLCWVQWSVWKGHQEAEPFRGKFQLPAGWGSKWEDDSLQCWSGPSVSMCLEAEASSYIPKFAHRTK